MSYIKNIIKVELTEVENLVSTIYPSKHQCIVPYSANFRQIQTKNPSSCEISDKLESKVRIFTTKLTFRSCEQINPDYAFLAFRVTTADGCSYLIGRDCRPFPVLTVSENMPSSRTDSSLITYTVTWSDVIKPLKIIG